MHNHAIQKLLCYEEISGNHEGEFKDKNDLNFWGTLDGMLMLAAN